MIRRQGKPSGLNVPSTSAAPPADERPPARLLVGPFEDMRVDVDDIVLQRGGDVTPGLDAGRSETPEVNGTRRALGSDTRGSEVAPSPGVRTRRWSYAGVLSVRFRTFPVAAGRDGTSSDREAPQRGGVAPRLSSPAGGDGNR